MAALRVLDGLSDANGDNRTNEGHNVEAYLRRTLGEEFFLLCKNFYESIWKSDAPYKVFLARRCMNLMYMFYMCADDGWHQDSLEKSFFSDGALLSNAREIAETYRETHCVPEILIADELLIHGRTLNRLLSELVERIYRILGEDGEDVSWTRLRSDVLAAVRIRVILQSNRKLLLYGIYQRNLRPEDICPIRRLHQFSSSLSLAIAGGVVANTSFVPTLQMRGLAGDDADALYQHLTERAVSLFRTVPYRMGFQERAWVYPLTMGNGAVKAIYTLRVVRSEMDGTYLVVPFVVFSDIRVQKGSLYETLQSKLFSFFDAETKCLAEEAYRYWRADSPAWMEALSLIFSQNLLQLMVYDCKISDWGKYVDYEKIRMSFRSLSNAAVNAFFDHVAKRTTPWMTMGQMNETMLELTYDSEPICHVRNADDIEPDGRPNGFGVRIRRIKEGVEDVLSDFGQQTELHAVGQLDGSVFLSGRGMPNETLSEILNRTNRDSVGRMTQAFPDKQHLCCVVSELLHHMDTGAAATVISYDETEDGEEYRNMCRAGEQSLFIMPQRYSRYIPILSVMEQDCFRNPRRLEYRMQDFLTPILGEGLTNELIRFIKSLYAIDQCVQDWDIDLSGWHECRWEESDNDDPKKMADRNMKELMDDLVMQNDLLDSYLKYIKSINGC